MIITDVVIVFLSKIHESQDVAGLTIIVTLVGNPHLDVGNLNSRCTMRQVFTPFVIVVAEVMGKEVVAVLVILIGRDVELVGL